MHVQDINQTAETKYMFMYRVTTPAHTCVETERGYTVPICHCILNTVYCIATVLLTYATSYKMVLK